MPEAMNIFISVCVASLVLSGLTKATRLSRHQSTQSATYEGDKLPVDDYSWSTMGMADNEKTTGSENRDSVPLMPLRHTFPYYDYDVEDSDNDTNSNCTDLCEPTPCESNEVCAMTPQCKYHCSTKTSAWNISELRPLNERMCDYDSEFECIHGVVGNCSESDFYCLCDEGWAGSFCDKVCTLPCVHDRGKCMIVNKQMRCVCRWQYRGHLCEADLPDPEELPRIIAAVLSSVLSVVIILAIVIPVIMWKLRLTLVLKLVYYFKEYEDDDGKTFDAYVSMTPTMNAESFVYGSLRPILEDLNFKLYLQARDAPAGEVMSETILSALERSRRTIMIVTRDYITNEWNRFEYLIAQHETLKLKQRIIPIILEDIEQDRTKMDKSLKHILDSIKCLKFPQAKSELITSNPVELSDIQSPDSNSSTTYFYRAGSSSSVTPVSKEEQKLEKKIAKFWKHLTLTMPKKKSKENQSSNILSKLKNHAIYDISKSSLQYNGSTKLGNRECNMQCVLEINNKDSFINNNLNNDDKLNVKIIGSLADEKNRTGDKLHSNKTKYQSCG